MNKIEEMLFEHLYSNALKTYKIEHLDCVYLREFAKSMYSLGYTSGFYDNIEEI